VNTAAALRFPTEWLYHQGTVGRIGKIEETIIGSKCVHRTAALYDVILDSNQPHDYLLVQLTAINQMRPLGQLIYLLVSFRKKL
jgi:hypothetical protein